MKHCRTFLASHKPSKDDREVKLLGTGKSLRHAMRVTLYYIEEGRRGGKEERPFLFVKKKQKYIYILTRRPLGCLPALLAVRLRLCNMMYVA
jgi:hypothetical protein